MKRPATLAAAGLAGLAGLHVAWAAGSSWPLPDKAALSDAVIGRDTFPSAAACLIVAGALTAGSAFRRWLASIARAAAAHGRSRRGRCISCAGRAGAGRSNTSHLSHILVRAVPRIGPPRLRPSLPCARRASGASGTAASAAGLRPRGALWNELQPAHPAGRPPARLGSRSVGSPPPPNMRTSGSGASESPSGGVPRRTKRRRVQRSATVWLLLVQAKRAKKAFTPSRS